MAVLVNEPMSSAPSTGTLKNNATFVTSPFNALRLNAAVAGQKGQIEYTGTLDDPFTVEFDFWTGGGTGGDAVWFYFGNSATPDEEGQNTGGYIVYWSEFSNEVVVKFAGSNVKVQALSGFGDSAWHTVEIVVTGQQFNVTTDGVLTFSHTDPTPRTLGGSKYGWGARSGFGNNNNHYVRNLLLTDDSGGAVNKGSFFGHF